MTDGGRADYGATTSDRQTFQTSLSSLSRDSILDAESAYDQKPSDALSKVQNGWGKFITGALTTIQNNTGMLLVAASQVVLQVLLLLFPNIETFCRGSLR